MIIKIFISHACETISYHAKCQDFLFDFFQNSMFINQFIENLNVLNL